MSELEKLLKEVNSVPCTLCPVGIQRCDEFEHENGIAFCIQLERSIELLKKERGDINEKH